MIRHKILINLYTNKGCADEDTHYDDNDNDYSDFDVFPPHRACQTSTCLLECHRLSEHWRNKNSMCSIHTEKSKIL